MLTFGSRRPTSQKQLLLLDRVKGASLAFSLRKLRNNYAGYAIRVRRSSDSTEQDIGFTGTNRLDIGALLAFVGAGNDGFISKWYDQSGNGFEAAQATGANQPQIVSAGAVLTQNSKPSVKFSLAGLTNLTCAGATSVNAGVPGMTATMTWTPVTGALSEVVFYTSTNGGAGATRSSMSKSASDKQGTSGRKLDGDTTQSKTSGAAVAGSTHVSSGVWDYTNSIISNYIDGVSDGSGAATWGAGTTNSAGVSLAVNIGSQNGINTYNGSLAELVVYPIALPVAALKQVEANQKAYHLVF